MSAGNTVFINRGRRVEPSQGLPRALGDDDKSVLVPLQVCESVNEELLHTTIESIAVFHMRYFPLAFERFACRQSQ